MTPKAIALAALALILAAGALWWGLGDRGGRAVAPPRVERTSEAELAAELAAPEEALPPSPANQVERSAVALELPPATDREQPALPSRGMVLDAATGEPVPWLVAQLDNHDHAAVDGGGRFDFGRPLDPGEYGIIFLEQDGGLLRRAARDQCELAGERWIVRIPIGPTYRLSLMGEGAVSPESMQGRLVEIRPDGTEIVGGWRGIQQREPLFVRYPSPFEPNLPGSAFRLEVQHEMRTWKGSSGPLESAVGVYPQVVMVLVDRALSAVIGRVVDTLERGKDRVRVTLVPLGRSERAGAWPTQMTGGDGRYVFRGVEPGEYRLLIRPRRGEAPQSATLRVRPGENEVADFVVAAQEGAGRIEGRLASRAGLDIGVRQIVRLRAVDGRDFELFDASSGATSRWGGLRGLELDEDGEGHHVFEFAEVPPGSFELSVVARDGYSWTPASVVVQPPNTETVFIREDGGEHLSIGFRVLDAETERPVDPFQVQIQVGAAWSRDVRSASAGQPCAELPAGVAFEWSVHAPGYRSARGDREAFGEGGGTRVAEVRLERGWGARLFFRDLGHGFDLDDPYGIVAAMERPAVAGVTVVADGRTVGVSDTDGSVAIELEREPRWMTFQAAGWRAAESRGFREGRIQGGARDVVLWMVRE